MSGTHGENNQPEPDFEDEEVRGDDNCPKCGEEYDEVDFEYQICHKCRHNNNGLDMKAIRNGGLGFK